MATWQQAGNSGALLAGLGGMNSNAPRASDADATLAYIRQNNEMERSGRNNVGLQALQGISSVMDMYKQMDQQKRQQEFQQAYADAYTSGDRDAMRKLASQYPEQFDAVRNGMKFVDEDQRSSVGTLAASARLAASSPEAMMSWLQNNSSELTRAGVDPLDVAKMYQQNPQGFTEFVDHLGMAALGPNDYFNVQDKMAGRQLEKGRLDESIRQADMENARGWANIQNAQLDRAQRAQMHNDNVALKLQELGMKQQESGKIDPKLVRDLNSDINGFSKNYSAMRSASDNLQALGKRNTPAAQLGMIFNYMKSLDPQSVVREGEQVQVKRTDGIFGTLGNYVSQLSNGKMLNNEQVQDLINTSKLMANTEGEKFNQQMDDYLSTYGDSLPSGLTKQLQSRKAKLYEDIQQPAQQQTQQATSGGQTFREGMTAKNPKTGQKIIYRNGQWQPM
ncbi:acyltransferase [Salmonella enterica subsp. enterica serovar Schwarzengrund]|uniref:phage DNA ejection protein n=1 Tax=Salmonella TaxID=590 RepID=UPI000699D6EB|nr:phage DNA ejection protein [Salmonella enterica]EBO1349086.1 acyltransferase [Salmonella enterica subsp. enterica]EBT6021943.1 acyltransferase [Salmonella enterica subsp. enterica serovar Thomasville]ECB4863633.1 acyltransferase [Salmonella enterica subsp. enterica serovar Lexington]EAQ6518423.1 acyltransferase [Salmonella enterica]EAS2384939.1 acyltransferase [Salmonella enterica]